MTTDTTRVKTPSRELSPLQIQLLRIRMGLEGEIPLNGREALRRLFPGETVYVGSQRYAFFFNTLQALRGKLPKIWVRVDVVHIETREVLDLAKGSFEGAEEFFDWLRRWSTPLPDRTACEHHWQIASPNGPTSTGTCRVCGEVREFKNSIQITSWESESSHLRRSGKTEEAREETPVGEEAV